MSVAVFSSAQARAAAPRPAAPPAKDASIHASVTVGGRSIPYTATAGTIELQDAAGAASCSMFYTAFTEDGVSDRDRRPVTFLYNGGPGSSTIWLRMGSFAPKRVVTADATHNLPPPYQLVDNGYSLIDKTDLVFIDAPGTGFSRIAAASKPKDFYGVDQDARAFKQFVERYLTNNHRWNSPKFLFGESYGTTRSAVLSNLLQQDGVDLNGVVLLSSALNYSTFFGGDGLDTEYYGYLPTEAAIAWYHNRVPHRSGNLAAFVQSARVFALGDYARALLRGSDLSDSARNRIASQLSSFTGISPQFFLQANLRIEPEEFEKEMMRNSNRTTGRLDARFLGIDSKATGDAPDYDPSSVAFASAYVSSFNAYVRDDIGFHTDLLYRPTAYDIVSGPNWDLSHSIDGNQLPYPDVVQDLHDAMTQNPQLHVFSANGYYDMATPFFATEYTLNHMELDPTLRGNITYGFYESGHMVYAHIPALAKFKADLARWYDSVLAR
jgi:carboxypeptidase C (cathepsin A)